MKRLFKPLIIAMALIMNFCLVQAIPPPNYQISTSSPQLQNEERICVSPTDSTKLVATWRDFRLGYRQLGVGISSDGGNTWTDYLSVDNYGDRQSDPELRVDRFGNFYFNFMDWDNAQAFSGLTTVKSTNNGQTWSFPPSMLSDPLNQYFEDKQFIAIDNTGGTYDGNIYMAWARYPSVVVEAIGETVVSKSTTALGGWTDPITIGPIRDFPACPLYNITGSALCYPIVGADGTVYVFWGAPDVIDCEIHSTIRMSKSTDGGDNWTEAENVSIVNAYWLLGIYIDGDIDVFAHPVCAADITGGPYHGNVYMAFNDKDTTNHDYEDYNIHLIKSNDGYTTWTDRITINDDPTGPGAMFDQFHPWLFCNQEGTLVIIFYDQRTDPENHTKFDVFAAYSFDGGESFTTNHRISDVSIDPALARSGFRAGKIAEYIGVTAFKDHVNAIWTDTRNGNQDVFGANWIIPLLETRLSYPADNQAFKTFDDNFKWNTAWKAYDDQYRIEVSDDPVFGSILYQTTTDTTFATSGLTFTDGYYYWRAKVFKISTGDSSEYSPTFTFAIDNHIPAYPNLISPPDKGSINNSYPTFTWSSENGPGGDNSYDLEISTDETFSDPGVQRTYATNDTTFVSPDQFFVDSVYYWRVKATNRWGESNDFGNPYEFSYVEFICGDVNGDTNVDLIDILYLIDFKYGVPPGPEPIPPASGDVNSDTNIDLIDILYLIDFKYGVPPGPDPNCM